jgi:hypothetical protein
LLLRKSFFHLHKWEKLSRMKGVAIINRFWLCVLKRLGCSLIVGLHAAFFLGCAPHVETVAQGQEKQAFCAKIAILPFQGILPDKEERKVVQCPICGSMFKTNRADQISVKNVENLFVKHLQRYSRIEVIPSDKAKAAYNMVSAEFPRASLIENIQKTGHKLNAEGAIVGYVYRYAERKGFAYSAEQPASVAFDVHLIRVEDGSIIWKGTFDETQRSLLENLLQMASFLKRGAKWLTAEELTQKGMDEIFKTFPVEP